MINNYQFKEIDNYYTNYKIDTAVTINSKINKNYEYISYKNLMIPNIFNNYRQIKKDDYLELVDNNDKIIITINPTFYYDFNYNNLKVDDKKNISKEDIQYYLKKNKINNELEIFAYIASKTYQKDYNFFSSIKYLKGRYGLLKCLYNNTPLLTNKNYSLEVINGDYDGYMEIGNDGNNYYKNINIIKNKKVYKISLISKKIDTFEEKLIRTLLTNLIIN